MKLSKFKRFLMYAKRATPYLLIVVVLISVIFYPKSKTQVKAQKRVVCIWNVDTFEGGKGSRTSFLKRVANRVEEQDGALYYMISSYTAEGANDAASRGERPDILSFGVGLSAFLEYSLPLPYSFSGGNLDGSCLAYPWCKGRYYLFSRSDNFEEAGSVVVSEGGSNLSSVAAVLSDRTGESVESLSAYVAFLNGKYRYLLGTQRDVCRFASRNETVYTKPLDTFCDLYQYVSVLSAEKKPDCMKFLNALFSEETQNELSAIGMFSPNGATEEKTLSVFTDEAALKELNRAAHSGEPIKNLDKFLKNV